jgi:hypothetical protein
MSFMSRFRKEKGDEDAFDDEPAEDEGAGLFMNPSPRPEGAPDQIEAPQAEAAQEPEEPPAQETPEAAEAAPVPTAEAEAEAPAGDDPLALFRSMHTESEASDLTRDMDDVSAEELLAELRELRAMLPITAAETEGE